MEVTPFQFQVTDISPVEKSLRFEIPAHYLQKKLDLAYKKAAREAEVPGFRKGKAPRSLIEQHYKRQIESDMFLSLFEETFNECVEKENFRLAGQPVLESRSEVSLTSPLTYQVRIETYPTVEVKNYEGLVVSQKSKAVTENEIEQALFQEQNRMMELKPIEGRDVLTDSDVVTILAEGHIGKEHYHNKKLSVDLGLPKESPVPGLAEALIGKRVDMQGEMVSFSLPSMASETPSEEKAELQISVQTAHQKFLPALDDEFAKDTGKASTLSELREKIRTELFEEGTRLARREMHESLIAEMLRQNPVPLPPSLVKQITKEYLETRQYEIFMRAMEAAPSKEGMTSSFFAQIAENMAKRDASFQFLARAIAEKNSMEVTEAELEKRLAERSVQRGISVARLKSQIGKEDPTFSQLRAQLLIEKVLDLVESSANIHKE